MIDLAEVDRSRALWWLLAAVLGSVLVLLLYSYVGTFVFGVFIYYAARPVYRRLRPTFRSSGQAAAAALFAFEVPFLAVIGYLLLLSVSELERFTGSGAELIAWVVPVPATEVERAIEGPATYVGEFELSALGEVLTTGQSIVTPAATFVVHFALAVALAFYLLRDGDQVAEWFRTEVGAESSLWLYASLVDRDLQVAYFGNVRTVAVVALLAVGVYNGLNTVAPPGLQIPIPNVLALLTGVATLVPVVVGKVVYVPLAVYLGSRAVETAPSTLWFPVLVAVVALAVLDLVPIMVVRPFLAGQSTHRGLMMFSYIFGGLLFGWYGVFLGPLLLIAAIHLVRVGVSDLAHGDPVTADVTAAHGLGAMPRTDREPKDDPTVEDGDGPPEE